MLILFKLKMKLMHKFVQHIRSSDGSYCDKKLVSSCALSFYIGCTTVRNKQTFDHNGAASIKYEGKNKIPLQFIYFKCWVSFSNLLVA